jgi:hypothetical protein
MTFESIAINFEGFVKKFDRALVKKFDPCVVKKFDPYIIKKFDRAVVKKSDPCVIKKFDPAVVKKFDPTVVKKFDLYILDHGRIYAALDKAKFFLNPESIIIYFCRTRHSGAALSMLNLQVIDYAPRP